MGFYYDTVLIKWDEEQFPWNQIFSWVKLGGRMPFGIHKNTSKTDGKVEKNPFQQELGTRIKRINLDYTAPRWIAKGKTTLYQ